MEQRRRRYQRQRQEAASFKDPAAVAEPEEGKVLEVLAVCGGPERGLSPPLPGSRCRGVVGAAVPADPKRW